MSDVAEENSIYQKEFVSNRDKFIKLLLEEITVLDMWFYKAETINDREQIKIALESLENLLKAQGYMNMNLSESDFYNLRQFLIETIKRAANNIGTGDIE